MKIRVTLAVVRDANDIAEYVFGGSRAKDEENQAMKETVPVSTFMFRSNDEQFKSLKPGQEFDLTLTEHQNG